MIEIRIPVTQDIRKTLKIPDKLWRLLEIQHFIDETLKSRFQGFRTEIRTPVTQDIREPLKILNKLWHLLEIQISLMNPWNPDFRVSQLEDPFNDKTLKSAFRSFSSPESKVANFVAFIKTLRSGLIRDSQLRSPGLFRSTPLPNAHPHPTKPTTKSATCPWRTVEFPKIHEPHSSLGSPDGLWFPRIPKHESTMGLTSPANRSPGTLPIRRGWAPLIWGEDLLPTEMIFFDYIKLNITNWCMYLIITTMTQL